tara:strand:- start:7943 stop:8785 length:843 start_codon:yes stop_codon:yes gene_type:complete
MKKILLLPLILLLVVSGVSSHGYRINDISLDWNPEMKANVFSAAKELLKVDEEPYLLDFDYELIVVKYDRIKELNAWVHPTTFEIYGYRDDSIISSDTTENFNAEQRKSTAEQSFLDNVPKEMQSELQYNGEKKLYLGTYEYAWFRYVDGAYVGNDNFAVEIDPNNGKVIAWRLSPFLTPKEKIKVESAISPEVAQKIAEITFNAEPTDQKPFFMIELDKPVWTTKVKNIYPFFVQVDARDGSIHASGAVRSELPQDYSFSDVPIVESGLIKSIYAGDTQ